MLHESLSGALPVNLITISHAFLLMQDVFRSTIVKHCRFPFWIHFVGLSVQKENMLKCLWWGKNLLRCSQEPLWDCSEGDIESGRCYLDWQIRTTQHCAFVLWLGQYVHTHAYYTQTHMRIRRHKTHTTDKTKLRVQSHLLSFIQITIKNLFNFLLFSHKQPDIGELCK